MLPEQVRERLVCEFLKGGHPVACELLQLIERIFVEVDQFAHGQPPTCRNDAGLNSRA